MNHTEVNGNPLGLAFAGRGDWAQALGVKTLAEDPQVDVLDAQGVPVMLPEFGLASGMTTRAPWGTRNDQDNFIR